MLKVGIENALSIVAIPTPAGPPSDSASVRPMIAKFERNTHCNITPFCLQSGIVSFTTKSPSKNTATIPISE